MAHQQTDPVTSAAGPASSGRQPTVSAWSGWLFFGGILMVIAGALNAIGGLVALFNEQYYLVGSDGLLVEVDYAVWGWTLLIYGIAVGLVGLGVLGGRAWARIPAVIVVGFHALLNLAFMAAYPIWSVIIIALDIVVIYALVVHGRDARALD